MGPVGLDLQIGKIFTNKEQKTNDGETLSLPPGGVAHIESRERVNMPLNIMGYLVPRNSYSERGLLMLNAGHIDPGWNAYITLEVINLSEEPFKLTVGEDRPFSIIFHYMHRSATKTIPAEDDQRRRNKAVGRLQSWPETLYTSYRDRIIKDLEKKFATSDEVRAAGMTKLTIFIVILSSVIAIAGGVALAYAFWALTRP